MKWLKQSKFEDFEPRVPAVEVPKIPKDNRIGLTFGGFLFLWGFQAVLWGWMMKGAGIFGIVVFVIVNLIYLFTYYRLKRDDRFAKVSIWRQTNAR